MKDFCKWLGVNEKVAKVVVWIFIAMLFLIVTNTMLESIGAPYYKLTAENLSKINYNNLVRNIIGFIICVLNFYAVILLIFKIKTITKTLKYSIIYLILNTLITNVFNYAVAQIFIILYILIFCYYFSGKNWKYILYGIGSIILNLLVQYVCYIFKMQYLNLADVSTMNGTYYQLITSIDYFIVIAIIIFLKEIISKRRSD